VRLFHIELVQDDITELRRDSGDLVSCAFLGQLDFGDVGDKSGKEPGVFCMHREELLRRNFRNHLPCLGGHDMA